MSRKELTEKERIKTALMRHRERMRKDRYNREFVTIYSDNLCPVCHHRHMVGAVCRKWRGSVCEKHCMECEHYQPMFQHCLFRESEPIDMRKWRGVCTHKDKDALAVFLHENLLYGQFLREKKNNITQEEKSEAFRQTKEIVAARTSPKYAIAGSPNIDNAPDENMSVINALTAGNDVIIPVKVDKFTFDGVDEMLQCVRQVKENFNPKITFRGCVITSFRNNEVNSQGAVYMGGLSKYRLMETKIHWSMKVDESTFAALQIMKHSPRSWAARDYKKLATEYLAMIDGGLSDSDNSEGRD